MDQYSLAEEVCKNFPPTVASRSFASRRAVCLGQKPLKAQKFRHGQIGGPIVIHTSSLAHLDVFLLSTLPSSGFN